MEIQKIKELREQGKTYQEIADIAGVTRQRIFQQYSDGKSYKRKIPLETYQCRQCGEEIISTRRRVYCSMECLKEWYKENGKHGVSRYSKGCRCDVCKTEHNQRAKTYMKKRYHEDEEFREKWKARNREYYRNTVINKEKATS